MINPIVPQIAQHWRLENPPDVGGGGQARVSCVGADSAVYAMLNSGSVTVECDSGNGYDGRLGVRISSIFVIGLGSMLGM